MRSKSSSGSEQLNKRQRFNFGKRTYVMGVLNVTPDSFSDGSKFFDREEAVKHGIVMARDGAHIIDVGGESTRPGAKDVSVQEEIDRVVPVVEALAREIAVPLSVDTRKSEVAEAAIEAGASFINDVSGLNHDERMAQVAAKHGCYLILMHMKGTPQDMQTAPRYENLIKEIIASLRESVKIAKSGGVKEEKIIIDPGIGFGKTFEHNLEILRRLGEFKCLGRPICIGTSRKSFIGHALGLPDTGDRLAGTIATCVLAVMKGADILRVHDIKECLQAARMTDLITRQGIA